jgi:hypothetical protein
VKIKFIEAPPAREYKVGDVVEFNGYVAEGYARKYILRGWAVDYVEPVKAAPVVAPVAAPAVKAEPKATLSLKPKDPEPVAGK